MRLSNKWFRWMKCLGIFRMTVKFTLEERHVITSCLVPL
jgi:hypothetical protein